MKIPRITIILSACLLAALTATADSWTYTNKWGQVKTLELPPLPPDPPSRSTLESSSASSSAAYSFNVMSPTDPNWDPSQGGLYDVNFSSNWCSHLYVVGYLCPGDYVSRLPHTNDICDGWHGTAGQFLSTHWKNPRLPISVYVDCVNGFNHTLNAIRDGGGTNNQEVWTRTDNEICDQDAIHVAYGDGCGAHTIEWASCKIRWIRNCVTGPTVDESKVYRMPPRYKSYEGQVASHIVWNGAGWLDYYIIFNPSPRAYGMVCPYEIDARPYLIINPPDDPLPPKGFPIPGFRRNAEFAPYGTNNISATIGSTRSNQTVYLQGSSNLVSWVTLTNGVTDSSSNLFLIWPAVPDNQPQYFYRTYAP